MGFSTRSLWNGHVENLFLSKTDYFVLNQTAPYVIILDVQVFKVIKFLTKLLTNCFIVYVNLWATSCILLCTDDSVVYQEFPTSDDCNLQFATGSRTSMHEGQTQLDATNFWGPILLIEICETQATTLRQVEGRRNKSPGEEHLCRFSVECLCVVNPVPIDVGLRSGTRSADVDEIWAVCGHGAAVSAAHVRVVIVRWAVSTTCLLSVVDSCAILGNDQRTRS